MLQLHRREDLPVTGPEFLLVRLGIGPVGGDEGALAADLCLKDVAQGEIQRRSRAWPIFGEDIDGRLFRKSGRARCAGNWWREALRFYAPGEAAEVLTELDPIARARSGCRAVMTGR